MTKKTIDAQNKQKKAQQQQKKENKNPHYIFRLPHLAHTHQNKKKTNQH
jgi:hypothetical protein